MYYELYIDVLFLVNFMMDYLLLLIVRKMLKSAVSHINLLIGALWGAGTTCLIVTLPLPHVALKFIAFHLLINTIMILIGLKIRRIRDFVKAIFLLYIGAFLMGGIMGYVRQYIRVGSLFFGVAVLAYYVILGIWNFISYVNKIRTCRCDVRIYMRGNEYQVRGLLDTGNSLHDSLTGKPVCIMERKIADKIFRENGDIAFRYIPYHTIGKSEGVLKLVKFDKMCVKATEEQWVNNPLIAISEENISDKGEYQMILNPKLF